MTAAPRRRAPAPAADDLRAALREVREHAALEEAELVAIVERAAAEAYARLAPEGPVAEVRLDSASGTLRLVAADGTEDTVLSAPPDFARQAALAARAAVSGRLRDAEQDRVRREGTARRGELIDTVVERLEGRSWVVRAPAFPCVLPAEEQVPGEVLERNAHLKVLVVDTRRRGREVQVVVSRSHPDLLRRLLEQEVPELADGRVRIRALAREPGRRSKVAVEATDPALDPEGACIGPRGVRIRAVVGQLGEEQVQVVRWSSDPADLVARALAPATVTGVELDEATGTAHVQVPAGQLSLAIGRAGENARLAARLTRWRIDIAAEEGQP